MKKILLALCFSSLVIAAENTNATVSAETNVPATTDTSATHVEAPVDVISASMDSHGAEIALRDSLLAARDSINTADKQALQTKLDVESARCENWEKSYAVLDTNFQTCTKMLRVYAETAEKKTEQLNEATKMNALAQSTSFIGGVLIGILVGWLIWD